MPTYEYICRTPAKQPDGTEVECGHKYEVFFKSFGAAEQEEPSEQCPKCSGTVKERAFSGGGNGFLLKGGGWYKDRYR